VPEPIGNPLFAKFMEGWGGSPRRAKFFRVYSGSLSAREGQVVPLGAARNRIEHIISVLILTSSSLGCVAPEPAPARNPFVGTWATADNDSVTIRQDTIVQTQPDGHSTALDKNTCRGLFRFAYDTQSRQTLTDLVPRQPDLRKKLSELLVEPSYPVARLDCDRGDQTYVLLNERQLVAIYRDGDIGAIDRLVRR
jgi:hypothetical protein